MTYLFSHFNGAAFEVWEDISNSILHYTGQVIKWRGFN